MVFFFTSPHAPHVVLYMGRDKFENEELIRWGWPEDWWFHVDGLSSAHVYLRLPEGDTIDTLPPELIEDCAQLTKANSIQGSKLAAVKIVYTPWSNLKKTQRMEVGEVGFHDERLVRHMRVEKNRDVVKLLKKSVREEPEPDLEGERKSRDRRIATIKRMKDQEERRAMQEKSAKEREEKELRKISYDLMFAESEKALHSNKHAEERDYHDVEEDFM